MSAMPSAKLVEAMEHVRAGTKSPYAAARDAGIALSTIYRSQLYKAWQAEQERTAHPPPPAKRK